MDPLPPHWLPNEKPTHAFCESVMASGTSPWHIRKLSPAGLKLTGGIDTPSLCERVRPFGDKTKTNPGGGGWDLNVRISPHHLEHCCPKCAEDYRKVGA